MAMNGDILGKAIADAIVDSEATAEGKQKCEEIWKKLPAKLFLTFKLMQLFQLELVFPLLELNQLSLELLQPLGVYNDRF